MSKKKLVIMGRGTAGVIALAYFTKLVGDQCDIELHHNPEIPPQAVGEGSQVSLPRALFESFGFTFRNGLPHVDGSEKHGIYKTGWAGSGDYMHDFEMPSIGMHFNAVKLQNYILETLKGKYKLVESNITDHSQIDADFIMDCSGKPSNYDDFNVLETIPVNSVYVTQCYWDKPEFNYTLTLARPWGWVFGIPLQNRCSIGYMYNNTISSIDEIKEDVKNVFEEYNLTPSTDTNSFSFKNYYRKKNFDGRVVYNGNASFFLEPLEATSIHVMGQINELALQYWFLGYPEDVVHVRCDQLNQEVEAVIMLHYFAGSKYDTKFWDFAKKRGEKCIKSALVNTNNLIEFIEKSKEEQNTMLAKHQGWSARGYGSWGFFSFKQNLENLDLYKKFDPLISDIMSSAK